MTIAGNRVSQPYSDSRSMLLVSCVTVALSYLVPTLVRVLVSNPQTVWPLWPGCAILVTGLLLVQVSVWPLLIPASFAAFALADLQAGVPLSSIAWFIPGNTVEVLISAVGLRYCFDGVPRLNSVRALAKYSLFAIVLAPLAGAFLNARGIAHDYWMGWKIVVLSEVLAFITVTPALLSWVSEGRVLMRRSRAHHLEGVMLIAGLILVSYIVFTVPEDSRSPALFYTLVPFLLWSALRFGWLGVSTSLIAVTSLSIWGAVYGRGPFSHMVPLTDPLPLQMFLVFASIPFMVLAALSEEHREAAHVVLESEERLRLAQWAAHIGTFDVDLRTGVDIWQPELEALYGLPPGGFGRTLTAFEDLIHPDDRERIIRQTQEMMRTGQPAEAEWRVVWPDGSVHWIAGRGQVLMDESSAPSRMLGVNIDVTEHKLAEQELASANERLHLAIEAGSVGGWDYDFKIGKSVWFGQTHAQLGIAPRETLGSPEEFWARVHQDDRERVKHAMRVARDKHQEFTEDFRVVWRDGTTHWLRSRGRYYYSANGKPERMLGISIDITQSKQAEQALRESEERLRLATQVGRIYAYDWDVTADVVVRSSEHVNILCLTEPLPFPQQQFIDKIHPDDRPKFLAVITGLTPESPTGEVTYRAVAADGSSVWLKSNGRGFFDAEGRLRRVIGMVADITDVKRAEEATVGMTRKLLEAQEQERARIARELHDDITQRLAMLAIELEQLEDDPSEIKIRAQKLRKQTSEISNDVQALSHDLHSSQLEYLGVVAGMRSWCKEFGERQRMQIDCRHDVRSTLPQELGLCLFRVLQEALHNAAKHSGVKRVEVQLYEQPGEIHLLIRDLGKGFEIETARQGRGLGLTSMRERVRLVNGTMTIDSKPMGGTTIHVRVPLGIEIVSQPAVGQ